MHIRSSVLSSAFIVSAAIIAGIASAQTVRTPSSFVLPVSSSSSSQFSATNFSASTSVAPSPILPHCGTGIEDKTLVWDGKNIKWKCAKIPVPMPTPPTCIGPDTALRFDGKVWKCETIGGLLVGHARGLLQLKTNKRSCDNVWGVATCKVNDDTTISLKCPTSTLPVETSALNSYISTATDYDDFGQEWHIYCYSRAIKVK